MIEWLNVPEETRRNAYVQIAEKTGMSPFAVEKDWWVVQTLSAIFDMEAAKALVFKGGTSLSKAWGLINRFSEDIDLAIDRGYLGFEGVLSKSKKTRLRKEASAYTSGSFHQMIKDKFVEREIAGVDIKIIEAKDSDQDPRIIEIYYHNVIPNPGYLEARVQIEIGCRSMREPFEPVSFRSLVDEYYSDRSFALPPISVPTVVPERTFLEKIFLLHEEFHRPIEKIRVDRLSRHIYDVVKMAQTNVADRALADPELYQNILSHRYSFSRVGGVDYKLMQPQTIDPLPIPAVSQAWQNDHSTMVEQMIFEAQPPSYIQLIEQLTILKERINHLPWKIETSLMS